MHSMASSSVCTPISCLSATRGKGRLLPLRPTGCHPTLSVFVSLFLHPLCGPLFILSVKDVATPLRLDTLHPATMQLQ